MSFRYDTVPTGPLVDYLNGLGHRTTVEAARAVGVDHRQYRRAVRHGRICLYNADRIAIRLGTHPVLIWGDTWLNADAYRSGRIDAAFDQLRQEEAA